MCSLDYFCPILKRKAACISKLLLLIFPLQIISDHKRYNSKLKLFKITIFLQTNSVSTLCSS